MKKLLVLATAIALAVMPAFAARIKVGVINNDPNESGYRTANVKDFEKVFTKKNGYDLKKFYSLNNDEQLQAARKFIQDEVDYLLISAADMAGWEPVLKDAKDNGIEVILFDRLLEADPSLYKAAIVSNMPAEGETAVKWLASQNLKEYKIIHIQGAMGSAAQEGRTGALDEMVKSNDNWEYVTQQTATWNADTAQQIVEAVISSGKDFNVIYAENDGMAQGAVKALDKAGITHGVNGKVIIMGFDCNKFALREVLAGRWNYDGQCNPFQAETINQIIKGKLKVPASKIIYSVEKGFDAKTIKKSDIDKYGLGE